MKKTVLFTLVALGLGACATEFSIPVTGRIGKEPAQGQSTARLNGDGSFYVLTTRGLRCEGNYDSLDTNPTITAPVSCNDGRTGNLIITRSARGGGTAIGRMSDGMEARFVFGDLRFEQAFGDGGSASTL